MRLLRRIHFIPNLVFCQYDFGQIHLRGGFFDALNKTGVSFLVEMRIGRKSGVRFHARKADFYKLFTKFSCEIGRFLLPVGVGALFCLLVGGDALGAPSGGGTWNAPFGSSATRRGRRSLLPSPAEKGDREAVDEESGLLIPVGANCVRPHGFYCTFLPLAG